MVYARWSILRYGDHRGNTHPNSTFLVEETDPLMANKKPRLERG